jgi:hypothetical protein
MESLRTPFARLTEHFQATAPPPPAPAPVELPPPAAPPADLIAGALINDSLDARDAAAQAGPTLPAAPLRLITRLDREQIAQALVEQKARAAKVNDAVLRAGVQLDARADAIRRQVKPIFDVDERAGRRLAEQLLSVAKNEVNAALQVEIGGTITEMRGANDVALSQCSHWSDSAIDLRARFDADPVKDAAALAACRQRAELCSHEELITLAAYAAATGQRAALWTVRSVAAQRRAAEGTPAAENAHQQVVKVASMAPAHTDSQMRNVLGEIRQVGEDASIAYLRYSGRITLSQVISASFRH